MKKAFSIIAALSTLLAVSCQKGDGDVDYGNSLIYIPQATVNGGIDNYYNVPAGGAENTVNFAVAEEDVEVYLGVLLSGKAASTGFTVGVQANADATASAAQALGATVLPETAYQLPATVSVPSGKNSATFKLLVDKASLKSYTGKYVLAVELVSPSAYELAEKATTVVVVIDADALKNYL